MKYKVIDKFKGRTLEGIKTYEPGTLIEPSPEQASRLIEAGKIRPVQPQQAVVEPDNPIVQRFRLHTRLLKILPSIKGTAVYEEIQIMIEQLFTLTDEQEICQALDNIEGIYQEYLKTLDGLLIQAGELGVGAAEMLNLDDGLKYGRDRYCFYQGRLSSHKETEACRNERNCVDCRLRKGENKL